MEATLLATGVAALFGAAGGVWGLVLAREAGRKEQVPAPPPPPIDEAIARALAQKPEWGEAFERALAKPIALQPLEVQVPEPDWHKQQITAIAGPQPELEKLVALVEEALARQPEADKRIEGLARILAEGMEPLADLPNVLSRLVKSGSNVTITQPPMLMVGGGNGGGGGTPPRRPAPRAVPRANPGPPTPTPAIPASYVGGSVAVPPDEPVSLLALIQQQLTPNCPGSSQTLVLSSEDSILVGSASAIAGPLSETNYAFELTPGGPPRIYGSSFPGNSTPLGDLQVFATAGGVLHVEVC